MSADYRIKIYEEKGPVFNEEWSGPVVLGRQQKGEVGPYARSNLGDKPRLVVASHSEDSIPRQAVFLEPVAGDKIRFSNLSTVVPIRFNEPPTKLEAGETRDLPLPFVFNLGRKTIRVQPSGQEAEPKNLKQLSSATALPGEITGAATRFGDLIQAGSGGNISQESVIRWLQVTMNVLQAAAGTTEFLQKAAQAVVDLVGLDSGRVLLLKDNIWREVAGHTPPRIAPDSVLPPSKFVLKKVWEEHRTFFEVPEFPTTEARSLDSVAAVVAAPILNRDGVVIGALYGDRNVGSTFSKVSGPITAPEATLVEVLAGTVAAGLERLAQEKKAVESHVRFEQFFTPELAKELLDHPEMLESRQSEVTILFCDIREFSLISEKLAPDQTMELVNDVMEALSECVWKNDGVIVDYIGDEIIAMWGAPQSHPDHAKLACQAALDMLDTLPGLNELWKTRTPHPIDIGIGVNTGWAGVGNTGTKRKFKYGPLGSEVNIASRLQGATRHFKTQLIIHGATFAQLDESFSARKLGHIRLVNIETPQEIYELTSASAANWEPRKKGFEQSHELYLAKDFSPAAKKLGYLQLEFPEDGPSLILLSRVVNAKVDPRSWSGVWDFGLKK